MAHVKLSPLIASISGKVGNLQFRTLSSGRTIVHTRLESADKPKRRLSPAEIAHRRRFGIISAVVAEIQASYSRIDLAAKDRRKIWERVAYSYSKILERNPHAKDNILRQLLLEDYCARFSDTK